jgi:hypothetical protein
MLKKVLIGLLFLTIISCNKKEDNSHLLSKYIQVDKVINTGCEFKGGLTGFLIAVNNDEISMKPQLTKEGLMMNVYNIKNNTMKSEIYKLSQSITDTLKYNYEPLDMEVNDKNIYALFGKFLLVIDKCNSNNTYLTNLIDDYQKLKVFGSSITLCRSYQFKVKDGYAPISIANYDLKTRKIIKSIDLTSDAFEFSYIWPINWLDISNKGDIAFTQSISSVQEVYNKNLELVQKLEYKPKNWKNVDMTELNWIRSTKPQPRAQDIGIHLVKTDDGVGCRMTSVNFANDSTILAFYTSPIKSEKVDFVRYCNIWKKKGDKWVLFDKELKDGYPELSSILSKENFPLNGSMHNLRFYRDKVYFVDVAPNQKELLQFGEKFSTVKKAMNKCFAQERIYHQLFIFKCRF